MDGWWPRSGSYMGQKARIRRSLSKDGQRTEVDRDEEGGTKIRRCFNVDGGGEDRERNESKKSQELMERKKVREVFPCDGGEGAVQNGSTTRTEQYSR